MSIATPVATAQQVEIKGAGRHYLCRDGVLRPSVTTLLQAINKPALVPWAANQERAMVTEAAAQLYATLVGQPTMEKPAFIAALTAALGTVKGHTRALEQAGNIGTQAHHYIEWILRKDLGQVVGPAPALSPKALLAYQAFDRWRDGVRLIPQRIENQVWSVTHGYAGTLDLLASITLEGQRCTAVLDWKTGKAVYAEALLQNVAYIQAIREMGHVSGPVYGVVVRLPKVESDPIPEMRVIEPDEQPALFEAFLHVKALWEWLQIQDRARQDARTRPVVDNGAARATGTPVAITRAIPESLSPDTMATQETAQDVEEIQRQAVLAELATAKAALARQPTDDQWARIVLAFTGERDPQAARIGALRELLANIRGMGVKDPLAIARVKAILARPVGVDTTSPERPPQIPAPRAASILGVDRAPVDAEPVTSPTTAAVLVPDDDPREALLTAIAAAKRQLERQPPEAIWAAIVTATCQTADLTNADAAVLNDLLVLVRGLVAKDAEAIACVSKIIKGSQG